MTRLHVDIRDEDGELVGNFEFPQSTPFVFEALLMLFDQISASCGVPAHEIIADLYNYRRTKNETLSDISC